MEELLAYMNSHACRKANRLPFGCSTSQISSLVYYNPDDILDSIVDREASKSTTLTTWLMQIKL